MHVFLCILILLCNYHEDLLGEHNVQKLILDMIILEPSYTNSWGLYCAEDITLKTLIT